MKCKCCDVILTDKEATEKDPVTGEFLDTCYFCLGDPDDEGEGTTVGSEDGGLSDSFEEEGRDSPSDTI